MREKGYERDRKKEKKDRERKVRRLRVIPCQNSCN
jgi:hypothetical protein